MWGFKSQNPKDYHNLPQNYTRDNNTIHFSSKNYQFSTWLHFSMRISFQLSPFIIVMFRLITTLPLWGFHFTKHMSTSPLTKVNKTLGKFIADRVPLEKYEPSFAAYQTFIEQSIFNNTQMDQNKLVLLDQVTKIYETYKLPSKKLLKLQNKLALECFEWAKHKGIAETINVLACIQRYNTRKALALYKSQKQVILKDLRSLSSAAIMLLLRFIKQEKIDEPLVRETAIEMLYSQINMFNQAQILNLLDCLAWSKKYINKEFLIRLGQRIIVLYKSGNIDEKHIYGILAYLSEIQVNLHTRSVYVTQLDELYELILPSVFLNISSINDVQLNRLTSAFRRSKYFDESMIQQLIKTCMVREIKEFSGNQEKKWNLSMQLRTFANIVNTVAVFNFKSVEFKAYTLSILKLLMSTEHIRLPAHIFSRLLWSICVLYERHEVSQIYPLIESYLDRAQEIPLHQAMNFYYCYLYLRTSHPRIGEKKDKIYKLLQGFHLETKSSNIQNEVFKTLLQIGVPCLSEYNLNNMICDIMIPEWNNIKNVIIEIHGFRHFFRNVKKLTGANALKTKIITSEMYGYYFISADEWMILEDKKTFLKDFIEHINEMEGKKRSVAVPIAAPKSGRIRGRPRVFRIGS